MNTRSSRKTLRSSSAKQTKPKELSKPKLSPKKSPSKPRSKPKQETYIVEAILEKKKMKGMWLYKVKWVDYPMDQCTWEPAKNLENVRYMVTEFNKTHRKEEDDGSEKEESKGEEEEEEEEKEEEEKEEGKEVSEKKTSTRKKQEKKTGNGKRSFESSEKSPVSKSPQKKVKGETGEVKVKSSHGRGRPSKLQLIPNKIVHAQQNSNGIIFTIEWKPQRDGTVPPQSSLTNAELRKLDKDLLLDYYESKLKFVKPSSASKNREKGSEVINHSERGDEIKSPIKSPVSLKSPSSTKNNPITIEEEEAISSLINPIKDIETIEKTILDAENLIQNEGQTIFADLGTNTVPEIRELTLDANMRIYDQSNPEGTDQASNRAQDTENTEKDQAFYEE